MIWGSDGSEGGILIVNIMKRIARRLCRLIQLHFGLVAFRIQYWKIRKVISFMIFGLGGRDHDSPNQLFLTLGAPRCFEKYKNKLQIVFEKYYLSVCESHNLKFLKWCLLATLEL